MIENKKPDNVVFNITTKKYDAAFKPYATSLGAPAIIPGDSIAWKNRSINKINHMVAAKYTELRTEYNNMMQQLEYNNLIFDAKFTFEPIIGKVYHLYKRKNGETFLSIIAPHECNFYSLGSFYLNVDQFWEKCD